MANLSEFVVYDPVVESASEVVNRWKVEGSAGNIYTVTMLASGLQCSCPGFTFRKVCKHTKKIASELS